MSESNEKKSEDAEDLAMKDITDPRESDVLCGRGGAALRHPGNQTYRRLVNLNKGLYITCLKTEKLKISRSIVAAIREQEGRFLERDSKKQTWYDIGDKKAIEKTSQALREGQPKLRQKMIDSGQIAPNHGNMMEHQFGNGIYNPGGRPPSLGGGHGSNISSGVASSGLYSSDGSHFSMGPPSLQPPTSMSSGATMDMPPPPSRTLSNDVTADIMMQRLSLSSIGPRSIPSWTPSLASMDGDNMSVRSRLRPSLQPRGSGVAENLGLGPDAAVSVLSDFSAYNGINENHAQTRQGFGGAMDMYSQQQQQFHQGMGMDNNFNNGPAPPPPPPAMSPMMESPAIRSGYDRRRLFAKMKFTKPPSQRGDMDGMPDIHMVDSSFSLMSNLSGHGSRHEAMMSNLSNHGSRHETISGLSNLSGHNEMMSDNLGVGSRRSLMSGLSRISDHSGNSLFSDLSKKIGSTNISQRSIAMSEVSGIDEGFETDEFNFDTTTKTSTST